VAGTLELFLAVEVAYSAAVMPAEIKGAEPAIVIAAGSVGLRKKHEDIQVADRDPRRGIVAE
jgi:hypothetical protein